MTDERPDIVVLGLGPAGARAAEAAAAAGLRVVAVERKRRIGHPMQCAEFVPAMIDQDVPDLDAVTVQRIERMDTYVEDGAPVVTPDFAGRMLDRAAFDALLARRAALAGAECRCATQVARIEADGAVRLASGAVLRPRVLIGADGPRSLAGRAIGAVNAEIVETRQMRLPLSHRHEATDIFLSPEIVGGYAWLFPRGRDCNLGIGMAAEARGGLKALLDRLAARLVGLGRIDARPTAHTGGAIPVGGMVGPVGRLGGVPVLLAGDAAGLANPITGGGIVAAVQSGALAGAAAAAWLGGEAEAVDDYGEELAALFGRSLAHAAGRRRALMARWRAGSLDGAALRRGWIAFDEYWTGAPA